jgi:RimJ/RimL family protein N-acetyltransferase
VPIPELQTDRLLLRGWQVTDVEPLAAINADPRVGEWLGGTLTPEQTRQRVTDYLYAWEEHRFGMWAVEERRSRRLVGRVGLIHWTDWTASPHDAEIGWTFHPDVWARGYATEAARAALRWAFGERQLVRIISITRPTNLASRRVMDKLGLTYRGEAFWRGFHQVWYGIEWEAGARKAQRFLSGIRRPVRKPESSSIVSGGE